MSNNTHNHLDEENLLLTPFSHQVCTAKNALSLDKNMCSSFCPKIGGHNIVLKYDDTTICKLLNSREQYFYETIPNDLHDYLPKYKGTIEVQVIEDEQGLKKFFTHNNNNHVIDDGNDRLKRLKCDNEADQKNESNSRQAITQLQNTCLIRMQNTHETFLSKLYAVHRTPSDLRSLIIVGFIERQHDKQKYAILN